MSGVRSLLFFYFLFLYLLPFSAYALYNGNPSFPMMPEEGIWISKDSWLGIKAGYAFDDIYDRKLKMETHRSFRKKVQKYTSLSHCGVGTFTFNQRVELFSTVGTMSCQLTHTPLSETRVTYHTQTHVTWGVGGRALLAYWGDLQLSINAVYMQANLPLSSLKVNKMSFSHKRTEIDFREWQIGMGISYYFGLLIPYIGVDYSDFRAKVEHLNPLQFLFPKKHVTFKEAYATGIFLGFGLCPHHAFNLNVETRVINENGISVSADFKF